MILDVLLVVVVLGGLLVAEGLSERRRERRRQESLALQRFVRRVAPALAELATELRSFGVTAEEAGLGLGTFAAALRTEYAILTPEPGAILKNPTA